ncbi:hypothetical protein ACFO3G_02075 [Falsiporphyromonas endometrii]|uniref:Uncharacterized protein n=1 Tax=Falsiporphyromonas endometrii TaxID=1387297 RepID=A0ABV9K687_9PORP
MKLYEDDYCFFEKSIAHYTWQKLDRMAMITSFIINNQWIEYIAIITKIIHANGLLCSQK